MRLPVVRSSRRVFHLSRRAVLLPVRKHADMPTLLILDDPAGGQRSLAPALRPAGFHVMAVNSVAEVVEFLACIRPDLLVIDARRRAGGCGDAVRAVRELHGYAELPIVLVSTPGVSDDGPSRGPTFQRVNVPSAAEVDALIDHVLARLGERHQLS